MPHEVEELAEIVERHAPVEGPSLSPVRGVHCIKISATSRRSRNRWGASLCVMAQGGKELVLGREVFRFSAAHYIATPIDLPVVSRVYEASPERPMLALKVAFDPAVLHALAAKLPGASLDEEAGPSLAIFGARASTPMLDAALRLARLMATPDDAPVLAPLATQELFFHLLKGPDGPAIRTFVRRGSAMHRISRAVLTLQSHLDAEVDVLTLAKQASMSRSAFFKHFKDATALSPIQYQKRLRLLEARRLMVDEGETAERSSFRVGYKSASQFSREYARMFGDAPLRDARKLGAAGAVVRD